MKKLQRISMAVLIITLGIMGIHLIAAPFADWIIRINGFMMIISLAVFIYSTVRNKSRDKSEF